MRIVTSALLISSLAFGISTAAFAQATPPPPSSAAMAKGPRPRVSPHETISSKIDGNRVTIVYGRPYGKDPKTGSERKIWGTLVPYGAIWRTGSDEATLFITQKDIMLGGTRVPAGVYTLFTYPTADGAKLVINKQVGQWGIDPYDASQELARVDLKKSATDAPVEEFTMSLTKNPDGGGLINMMWENTQYSVGYTVAK